VNLTTWVDTISCRFGGPRNTGSKSSGLYGDWVLPSKFNEKTTLGSDGINIWP